jgi:nucleotide-binding universal stress UspA family protein
MRLTPKIPHGPYAGATPRCVRPLIWISERALARSLHRRLIMTVKVPYIIVVGVDYSEVSRLALREGLRLASERGESEIHVVHVEPETHSIPALWADDEPPTEVRSRQTSATVDLNAAAQRLHRLVIEDVAAFEEASRRPEGSAIQRVVSHVRTNSAGREIAQLAVDLEADLVVVGTHGRTRLARIFLGSVAHAVVTQAPCPVLVVRPKQTSLVPGIEPPCPRCLEARKLSGGTQLWCDQHRAQHGQRHTYHQDDRVGQETNFPLVFDER